MTRTKEAKLNLMHKFQETAKIKQKVTNNKTSLRHMNLTELNKDHRDRTMETR